MHSFFVPTMWGQSLITIIENRIPTGEAPGIAFFMLLLAYKVSSNSVEGMSWSGYPLILSHDWLVPKKDAILPEQ